MDAHSETTRVLANGCRLAAVVAQCLRRRRCGDGSAPAPAASAPPRPVTQSDLQIAQSVYGTGPRTPAGFYSDPPPSGHDYVSTTHLKNADVDAAVVAPQPLYELCTDDWSQALEWSETRRAKLAAILGPGRDQRRSALLRVRPRPPGRPDVLRACARVQVRVSGSCISEPASRGGRSGNIESTSADSRRLARNERVPVAVHALQQRRLRGAPERGSTTGTG